MPLCPVGEDIQNAVFYGICQNTLVFTGIRISFEFILLIKMFPTAAGISSFSEHKIAMFQLEGKILDCLGTVIMDFFCGSTTVGTNLL